MSELALVAAAQVLDPRELEGESLPPLSHFLDDRLVPTTAIR